MPASPARVSGEPPARHREPRDLGEAARDERRARVVAEAEAVDRARRDGDHVLQRAAALDADDVVARVEAEVRRVEALHDRRGPRRARPR